MAKNRQSLRTATTTVWSVPKPADIEITEEDELRFFSLVSNSLSPEQIKRVITPPVIYFKQRLVFAVHWHPEFINMSQVEQRLKAMFPNSTDQLIIPTQHNLLTSWGDYTGVEVDCFSEDFNQKIQLLLHFRTERVEKAHTMRAMLEHTRKYRASQLFDLIHAITKPVDTYIAQAAAKTGADKPLVDYVHTHVAKIDSLLNRYWERVPTELIRNKLLNNWFDMLRQKDGQGFIERVQFYLKEIKTIVKDNFPLEYFYRTHEVIEEARSLGAGIVIPHPEQFWPVLMAEYDVDGWEVWNPQSRRYTKFLIDTLNKKNQARSSSKLPLLVFMGDDTHFGEKVKPVPYQDNAKSEREVGLQPWEDMLISKQLILSGMSRAQVMTEYRARLDG